MLSGDAGDQGLGAVPAGHPEQVSPTGHRVPDDRGDVHIAGAVEQRDLRTQRNSLRNQVEPNDLAAAGPGVHHLEK